MDTLNILVEQVLIHGLMLGTMLLVIKKMILNHNTPKAYLHLLITKQVHYTLYPEHSLHLIPQL